MNKCFDSAIRDHSFDGGTDSVIDPDKGPFSSIYFPNLPNYLSNIFSCLKLIFINWTFLQGFQSFKAFYCITNIFASYTELPWVFFGNTFGAKIMGSSFLFWRKLGNFVWRLHLVRKMLLFFSILIDKRALTLKEELYISSSCTVYILALSMPLSRSLWYSSSF